jgi:hypothetical protein
VREQAGAALREPSVWELSSNRAARLRALEESKYGLAAVRRAFEQLVAAAPQVV